MEFVIYHHWEQLPGNANALFSQAEQESLFYSLDWLETLTTYTLTENTLQLACVIDHNRLLAILPLIETPQNCLTACSNHYTSLFTLLMLSGQESMQNITHCLAEGLAKLPYYSISLDPLAEDDRNLSLLCEVLCSHGYSQHRYFRFYNWSHRLHDQSFDDYMAARPAHLRNTIKRKQRKLERQHDFNIRLYTNVDLDRALEEYKTVYHASWKANEYFHEFTPALVKRLASRGWLRLAILTVDQQPIAAQIWFVVHGKANIFRLVYDEQWKQYSPGSILTEYLMRHVITHDQATEMDFLTGNEAYKQDWMNTQKKRCGIRLKKQAAADGLFSRLRKTLLRK